MNIRPILITDIPQCVEIYKLNNHLDSDEWINLLRNELEAAFEQSKFVIPKYFVCEQDGVILGFGGYANCGFDVEAFGLTWCNVHPEHQGQGVGKLLVEARLKSIINEGGKKVFSSQREEVTWHLERFGFERIEENGELDGDKYFLMRKKLG